MVGKGAGAQGGHGCIGHKEHFCRLARRSQCLCLQRKLTERSTARLGLLLVGSDFS